MSAAELFEWPSGNQGFLHVDDQPSVRMMAVAPQDMAFRSQFAFQSIG